MPTSTMGQAIARGEWLCFPVTPKPCDKTSGKNTQRFGSIASGIWTAHVPYNYASGPFVKERNRTRLEHEEFPLRIYSFAGVTEREPSSVPRLPKYFPPKQLCRFTDGRRSYCVSYRVSWGTWDIFLNCLRYMVTFYSKRGSKEFFAFTGSLFISDGCSI